MFLSTNARTAEDIERDIELARERIWEDIYDENVDEPNGNHVQFINHDDQEALDEERYLSTLFLQLPNCYAEQFFLLVDDI